MDWSHLTTSHYFQNDVLRRRPYLQPEWFHRIVENAVHTENQKDGRTRYWVFIPEYGKYLRIVVLADGETRHNAFFDRRFKGGSP
jgi:hypothetical protein